MQFSLKAISSVAVVSAVLVVFSSCHTSYQASGQASYRMTSIDRSRILVDNRYDANPDEQATAFIKPYEAKVDSIMKPVVGYTAHAMAAAKPESDLSNLLSDILVWGGSEFNEKPDFGVYNMGGIRATFPEGKITYGDVLNVAPFENHICFLTLTGEKVLQLFREMAVRGGEGVSHSVKMVITKDGKLLSATINGENIVPEKDYRVSTLDYLAQGNDGLTAFKSKTNVVSPKDSKHAVRYIIVNYFKAFEKQGKPVDANVEGRVVVK